MYVSYDYEDLIEEIENDISEGFFNENGDILILRDQDPIITGNEIYYPIIDYYDLDFEEDTKAEIKAIKNTVESGRALYSDHVQDLRKLQKMLRLYSKDKKRLERTSIRRVLEEMKEWNSLF